MGLSLMSDIKRIAEELRKLGEESSKQAGILAGNSPLGRSLRAVRAREKDLHALRGIVDDSELKQVSAELREFLKAASAAAQHLDGIGKVSSEWADQLSKAARRADRSVARTPDAVDYARAGATEGVSGRLARTALKGAAYSGMGIIVSSIPGMALASFAVSAVPFMQHVVRSGQAWRAGGEDGRMTAKQELFQAAVELSFLVQSFKFTAAAGALGGTLAAAAVPAAVAVLYLGSAAGLYVLANYLRRRGASDRSPAALVGDLSRSPAFGQGRAGAGIGESRHASR